MSIKDNPGDTKYKLIVGLIGIWIAIQAFLSQTYASGDRVTAIADRLKAQEIRVEKRLDRIESKIDSLLSKRRDL